MLAHDGWMRISLRRLQPVRSTSPWLAAMRVAGPMNAFENTGIKIASLLQLVEVQVRTVFPGAGVDTGASGPFTPPLRAQGSLGV